MTTNPTGQEALIAWIVESLTIKQRELVRTMNGDHPAGDFGWVSSNAAVQLRAINRCGALVERHYRGGRNLYRLSPLGQAVRAIIEALSSTPESKEQFAENANWSAPEGYVLVPVEVLAPFVNVRDQFPQTVKLINPKLDGMSQINLTVTKAQFLALHAMLSSSPNKGEG